MKDINIEGYTIKDFTTLSIEESAEVLSFRNHESVRRWMYNAEPISYQDHLNFIARLKGRTDKRYWAIYQNGEFIGSINLTDINEKEKRATWGCYLNPSYIGSGKGIDLEFISHTLFFTFMGINIIQGEVNNTNINALNLHKLFDYKFMPIEETNYTKVMLDVETWQVLPKTLNQFKVYMIKKLRGK